VDILKPALTRIHALTRDLLTQLPNIVLGIVVFFLFYWLGKFVRGTMRNFAQNQKKHLSLGLVLGRLAQGGIVFVGLLIALVIAIPSFQPAQLIQILGISGVAIGFAFKDILQNFLAGILLLLTEPFRLGDQIKVGAFEGTVEDIQTRATFIKTYDGRRVVIPNGELFNQSVTVNTAYDHRRLESDFGIGFGDSVEDARAIILQVLREDEVVLSDPAPDVLLLELGASSVNLRARWWIAPPRRRPCLARQDHHARQAGADRERHRPALPDAADPLPRPDRSHRWRPQAPARRLARRQGRGAQAARHRPSTCGRLLEPPTS